VLISSLKAYFMDDDISALYQLRECQGGHGYHSLANIPGWLEAWSPNVTLEGDGFVLYQQTARKLFKILKAVQKGKTVNKILYPYMEQVDKVVGLKEVSKEITCAYKLSEVLRVALSHQLLQIAQSLETHTEHSFDAKWNKIHQIDIAKVARLHGIYLTSISFIQSIEKFKTDKKTIAVMTDLCKVFITEMIIKFGEAALINNYITGEQMAGINSYHNDLIDSLKPHVVSLVECQIIHEAMAQGTTLSNMDDDYATKLYERAAFSSLNNTQKLESIDTDLKPLARKLTNFAKI